MRSGNGNKQNMDYASQSEMTQNVIQLESVHTANRKGRLLPV